VGEHDRGGVDGEVRSWLRAWGAEVAARDFDAAERRMALDVIGFGTRAAVARGLAALRSSQWEHVWPAIDGFVFDADTADVWASPDGRQAVIGAAWRSVGRTESGRTFPREGRATVVLTRDEPDSPWLGRHTHFSLQPVDPGTFTEVRQ
jgi:ketosteroid isomerase-like protein